jgi:hypothetical protein
MEVEKRGGSRKGAGRKPKASEEKVRRLGLEAIDSIYGSVEEYYKHIAKESLVSFPHLKLLQEYVFGKPKETIILEESNDDDFDYSTLSDKTLKEIAGLENKTEQS